MWYFLRVAATDEFEEAFSCFNSAIIMCSNSFFSPVIKDSKLKFKSMVNLSFIVLFTNVIRVKLFHKTGINSLPLKKVESLINCLDSWA